MSYEAMKGYTKRTIRNLINENNTGKLTGA